MTVDVPTTVESGLLVSDRVEAFVDLPNHQPRGALRGSVSSRRAEGPSTRFGIAFEVTETDDLRRQRDALITQILAMAR